MSGVTDQRPEVVAVDFDGTIVKHRYPVVGAPVKGALDFMKELQAEGVKLILWTMRSGRELQDAIDYCRQNGVTFYAHNVNPTQRSWTHSPKAYAQLYIDDAALGCPLSKKNGERPWVNWAKVKKNYRERWPALESA